jgi:tRNA-dihydrouridine synthase B
MRIGAVTIDPPVVLAPMSGITDVSFRLLCKEAGAGLVYTGLISANALQYRSRKTAELLAFSRHEHPVCAQVFGAEPEVVASAAAAAEAGGADLVDLNMGCAVPKVLRARAGVALMADPERAEAMVRATVAAVRVPVAVKMRSGWKDRGEGAVAFARRCERAGAALITVHPRWARQRFLGEADWDVIAAVKQAVRVPVIGNGDIRHGADAVRMTEMTHSDGVMIGRAALGNPWVFAEVAATVRGEPAPPPPTVAERIALAKRHLSLAIADRGPVVGVQEMRKHIAWYLRGLPGARALREETNRAATEAQLRAVLGTAAGGTVRLRRMPPQEASRL